MQNLNPVWLGSAEEWTKGGVLYFFDRYSENGNSSLDWISQLRLAVASASAGPETHFKRRRSALTRICNGYV